jgi:hypothetical protein
MLLVNLNFVRTKNKITNERTMYTVKGAVRKLAMNDLWMYTAWMVVLVCRRTETKYHSPKSMTTQMHEAGHRLETSKSLQCDCHEGTCKLKLGDDDGWILSNNIRINNCDHQMLGQVHHKHNQSGTKKVVIGDDADISIHKDQIRIRVMGMCRD